MGLVGVDRRWRGRTFFEGVTSVGCNVSVMVKDAGILEKGKAAADCVCEDCCGGVWKNKRREADVKAFMDGRRAERVKCVTRNKHHTRARESRSRNIGHSEYAALPHAVTTFLYLSPIQC